METGMRSLVFSLLLLPPAFPTLLCNLCVQHQRALLPSGFWLVWPMRDTGRRWEEGSRVDVGIYSLSSPFGTLSHCVPWLKVTAPSDSLFIGLLLSRSGNCFHLCPFWLRVIMPSTRGLECPPLLLLSGNTHSVTSLEVLQHLWVLHPAHTFINSPFIKLSSCWAPDWCESS